MCIPILELRKIEVQKFKQTSLYKITSKLQHQFEDSNLLLYLNVSATHCCVLYKNSKVVSVYTIPGIIYF